MRRSSDNGGRYTLIALVTVKACKIREKYWYQKVKKMKFEELSPVLYSANESNTVDVFDTFDTVKTCKLENDVDNL